MTRKEKRYLKKIYIKNQRLIWQSQFNVAIIDSLVLEYSRNRLVLLEKELATWKAKDKKKIKGGAKKKYDGTKKLEEEITNEKNVIAQSKFQRTTDLGNIKTRRGKLKFLKQYIRGKYKYKGKV